MGIAGFLVGGLVFLGFVSYILLMIFYPEWVGITGKSERERFAKEQSDDPSTSVKK